MKLTRICLLIVALCLPSAVARAEDASTKEQAHAYFKTGLSLARAGDLQGALEAFQHAYDTRPHYAVLYNLGCAYEGLNRPIEAASTFERFLEEGRDHIEASRRQEVEATVARLRAGFGRAELEVDPPEAEVFLDGARLGPTPLDLQDLRAGEHVLAARLSGRLPRIETVTVPGGGQVKVTLTLEPVPPPPLLQPTPLPPPVVPPPISDTGDDTAARRYWALGVGITGVGLASAAIATFAWNNGRYDTWQDDRARFEGAVAGGATGPAVSSSATDLRERAVSIERADDLALGMAVTAGCALVTSGVLWLTTLGKPKSESASARGGP